MLIIVGKKYEGLCPSTHNVKIPVVKSESMSLIDIEDGFMSLNDEYDEQKDVKLPGDDHPDPELGQNISDAFEDLDDGSFVVSHA